mmetsp:Transcript_18608/g.37746  ORF Transcript_18608/g.37746 Transcript_18608/m.37746 type:complete len:83 (-) Transcript_18608:482-730(-)
MLYTNNSRLIFIPTQSQNRINDIHAAPPRCSQSSSKSSPSTGSPSIKALHPANTPHILVSSSSQLYGSSLPSKQHILALHKL